jgi:hypothetical protein
MSTVWRTTLPGRPWLRRQVGRLRSSLDSLLCRLREDLSQTIARTVAEAVREAVRQLAGDPQPAASNARPSPYASPCSTPGVRSWQARPDPWGDDLDDPENENEPDFREPISSAMGDMTAEHPRAPMRSHWSQVLAMGFRAASWWIGRSTRHPILGSSVVAVVAALSTALVGPALVTGAAGIFLGWLALIDSLASATAALDG